jgi:PKD repeat protein
MDIDPPSCSNLDCTHCYALLISGGVTTAQNYARYYIDMVNLYLNLTGYPYCYPKDHIYVLMSDGTDPGKDQCSDTNCVNPTSSDPNGLPGTHYMSATVSNLMDTFNTLRSISNQDPQSTLFIFTTNHGGNDTVPGSKKSRLYLWGTDQFIWDSDFVNNLSTKAREISMTMEQCYGGGFNDNFISGAQKRVIATAANASQSSVGHDFSAAWIAGLSGEANKKVNGGNGDQLISSWEDFYYGRAHDLSALGSKPLENPTFSTTGSLPNDDGNTTGLSSCSLCTGVSLIPGGSGVPQDKTSPADGLYEDVNGDNTFNKADAAFFFTNMEYIAASEPTCAFDFNGNGGIDFGDIVKLYSMAP